MALESDHLHANIVIRAMWILLYLSLFLSGSVIEHDVHLSKSEVNYDTESQTVQVSIMLFLDDLEDALSKRGAEDLKLYSNKESEDADNWIEDYLSEKLRFTSNGKSLEASYLGREITEDFEGVWCYLEIPLLNSNQPFAVTNEIFMEIFDDQKHVMVITKDLKRIDHWIIAEDPYTEEIRF